MNDVTAETLQKAKAMFVTFLMNTESARINLLDKMPDPLKTLIPIEDFKNGEPKVVATVANASIDVIYDLRDENNTELIRLIKLIAAYYDVFENSEPEDKDKMLQQIFGAITN